MFVAVVTMVTLNSRAVLQSPRARRRRGRGAGATAADGAKLAPPPKPAPEGRGAERRRSRSPTRKCRTGPCRRIGSRVAIWMVAAAAVPAVAAVVLAIPIFALIVEAIGTRPASRRYDRLAHESPSSCRSRLADGDVRRGATTFMLIILYPKFTNYMMSVFSPTSCRTSCCSSSRPSSSHVLLPDGGSSIRCAPRPRARPERRGRGHHVHRQLLADVHDVAARRLEYGRGAERLGGRQQLHVDADQRAPHDRERRIRRAGCTAAYAAFKFLNAETDEERAHYDWMGYIGNFVAISAFLPLPFAGYWLAKENVPPTRRRSA